jgi:phospholipid/cholesterol/gamma-HCH transport system substrate-binding protein
VSGPAGEAGSIVARAAALGALVLIAILAALLLLGDGGDNTYRLRFETGGQLVPGNEVRIGGRPVGSINSIELTDDNQAEVEISVSDPITDGTTAVIRSTSLSGIANRYVSLTPGPAGGAELANNAVLIGEQTTTPVDLDQLFDAFRPKTRRGLRNLIRGFGTLYAGKGEEANRTFRFLNPALVGTERLLRELNRDREVLAEFVSEGSQALGAIADRRDDLSALVGNTNEALGAIATENESLDRSLVALAPTLRQANTTFVNLRSALDDLDPLVETSIPATKDLAPFLADLRPVVRDAVPVVTDLNKIVKKNGKANDLRDLLSDLPDTRKRVKNAVPRVITGLDELQPVLEFARPYFPDLLGWITKFGQVTAYYDANGHYARVQPAGANVFSYDSGTSELNPIYDESEKQYDFYTSTLGATGLFLRCPGAATQAIAGSNPFLDDGNLGSDDCNPAAVPIGP